MRYADGPTARVEISIDAPPEQVWELISDIGLPARLSPELQETFWLDGATGPAVGARFEGRNAHEMVGEWRTQARVELFDAPKAFAWSVAAMDGRFGGEAPSFDHPVATWRFELESRDGGRGTLLRQTARMGPARSGVNVFIDQAPDREEELVAIRLAQLHTNIEATLRGVKTLAEAHG